jgi:hypothetical protein
MVFRQFYLERMKYKLMGLAFKAILKSEPLLTDNFNGFISQLIYCKLGEYYEHVGPDRLVIFIKVFDRF